MFIKLKDITIFVLLFPLANSYITLNQVSECTGGQKTISLSSSSNYNSAGILKVSKEGFLTSLNCNITLIAPTEHRIVISFQEINLRKRYGECLDYLKIWTSKNSSVTKCGNYKYWKEELSFQSSENTLLMTFYSDGNFLFGEIDLTLTFTSCFYRGYRSTCGNINNFQCDNLCCIYDGLTCDGHNNCGDSSDESPFGNSDCRSSTAGAVIGIVLALVIVVIAMSVTIVIYRRKRKVTVSYIRTPTSFTAPPPYVTSSSLHTSENPTYGTSPPPYTSVNSAYSYNSNMCHDDYTNHQIPPSYEVQTSNIAISNPIYAVNNTDPLYHDDQKLTT